VINFTGFLLSGCRIQAGKIVFIKRKSPQSDVFFYFSHLTRDNPTGICSKNLKEPLACIIIERKQYLRKKYRVQHDFVKV
jgi:hypothetical protein